MYKTCFGCPDLIFFESPNMLFGWWECPHRKKNDALVGKIGGYNYVCEPPERKCGKTFDWETGEDEDFIE